MQCQGICTEQIGLVSTRKCLKLHACCFTVGLVVLSPLLGRSETAPGHQRRLMLLAMMLLDAVTGIWMLLQYAYEVWGLLGTVQCLSCHKALMGKLCMLYSSFLHDRPCLALPCSALPCPVLPCPACAMPCLCPCQTFGGSLLCCKLGQLYSCC